MQEIVSDSSSLMGTSTPIEKDAQIESNTGANNYYYGQNDFYYQNPAVAAAVLHQHYQYSNSAFSVNSLVENSQDQSNLVNHLHKPILNLNWQPSAPNMSKICSPNTNPTNTSSSSDSEYFASYQDQDKTALVNDVSNDFQFRYQQHHNLFNNTRNFLPQGSVGNKNTFYPYDQYPRQYHVSMSYYSSPKYEDIDVKNSKIVSSSPKVDQLSANQVLCSSSSSSFSSSPNSNKNTSTPTTGSSQNTNISNASPPESFEWMKPVKSAPNGKTRTKDKYRVVYSEPQRVELEKEFLFSKYITIKRKAELSQVLNLSERQIKIWFQNRRAKERKTNRKQKMSQSQQESVSSTTKSIKNEYSDDEMEDEFEESVNGDDSNETKSELTEKKCATINQNGISMSLDKNSQYQMYPSQGFNQTQFSQPAYNQYSPVNSYQNFYQASYPSYQQNFPAGDYSGFVAPGQTPDFNQMAPVQQNFQFSNSDYLINRPGSSSLAQPAVNSSNSIIQVLSQFQSI